MLAPKRLKKNDSVEGLTPVETDMDAATQKYLEAIDSIQDTLNNITAKANEEILVIEQKYSEARKPHYEKREEIIRHIPNFWTTAIINHPDLGPILDDKEEECLHHLIKLEIVEANDLSSGYKINFYFAENPFFENQILTKEHQLGKNPKSISTIIKWKDGQSLIKEGIFDETKMSDIEYKSFFNWFCDNLTCPTNDDIAEIFKDDLWVNPLYYYLVSDYDRDVEGDESENSDPEEIGDNTETANSEQVK